MAAAAVPQDRASSERRFFTGMALALLATVFVGFARSFFLRPLFPDHPAPRETIFYVHGALFTAWLVLLVAQARLIAGGRTGLHRKIGWTGALLAAAMVALGAYAALVAARRPTGFVEVPVPPLQFLAVPVFDLLLFGPFVALAILRRGDPQTHKRWMLLATFNLATPAFARWPGMTGLVPFVYFGLTDLFLVALVLWDRRSRGRVHPVTRWGGLLLVVSQPLRLVVSGTAAWLAIARWATGLLG